MKSIRMLRTHSLPIAERKEARYLSGRTYEVADQTAAALVKVGAAEEVPAEKAKADDKPKT